MESPASKDYIIYMKLQLVAQSSIDIAPLLFVNAQA
jgi:hypothetical protein